jgi:lipoprotein-anchoring transpeptidase ErfK/SrfK
VKSGVSKRSGKIHFLKSSTFGSPLKILRPVFSRRCGKSGLIVFIPAIPKRGRKRGLSDASLMASKLDLCSSRLPNGCPNVGATGTDSARSWEGDRPAWRFDPAQILLLIGVVCFDSVGLGNQGQDMCLLASPRHFGSLVIVAFLAMALAFPASAQTSSDSNTQSIGPAGAQVQSESTGGPSSSNPATAKTDSNTATPSTQTNSTAAKAESEAGGSQPQSNPEPKKTGSAILININKAKQKMTVFVDGIQKYDWPVSTGRAGYSTPSGTYTATSMNEIWYSKEWDNSPMPHSIFFIKDGHAVHGSYEVKNLGKPVSHGCVRISPENATTLYALVKANGLANTHVVLTGVTPGGESKSARAPVQAHAQAQADPGSSFSPFGAPNYYNYYNGPQGYYRWPSAYSRW